MRDRDADVYLYRGSRFLSSRYPPFGGSLYYGYPSYYSYYDPWYYRGGYRGLGYGYGYGRYWHDPYLYGASFGPWPYYWESAGGGGRDTDRDDPDTGALRLRVTPSTASVYVDGALAGVVDEFDGLTGHLRLPIGRHQIEFRAPGYQSHTVDVEIERGKTKTERAKLRNP